MLIKIEDLAPKNIINFYVPHSVTEKGFSLLFFSAEKYENEFLQEIFADGEITRCFVTENLISIQYNKENSKENIKALVLAAIDDYMQPNVNFSELGDFADLLIKCEAVADAFIRPTLNRDKGDIVLVSLKDNILEVRFTGHCAGCPYAQNTLQNVIVRTFKRYLPQIKEVKLKE